MKPEVLALALAPLMEAPEGADKEER